MNESNTMIQRSPGVMQGTANQVTEVIRGTAHKSVAETPNTRRHFLAPTFSYQSIELFAAALEAMAIVLACVIGGIAYHILSYDQTGDPGLFFGIGIVNSFTYVLLAKAWGLYELPVLVAPRQYIARIATAWGCVFLILMLAIFLIKAGPTLSRGSFVSFAALQLAFIVSIRFLLGHCIETGLASGSVRGRRAVLIGSRGEFASWAPMSLLKDFGVQEVARVTLPSVQGERIAVEESASEAIKLARSIRADGFALAIKWENTDLLTLLLDQLRKSPLPVTLLPCSVVRSVISLRAVSSSPLVVLELQRAPLTKMEQALKRAFDIVFAGTSLLLLSPLLGLLAVAIKCDSSGPVIFRQKRNGFDGDPFVIFKFRTMTVMENGPTIQQAQYNDPRVTRIGRMLRKWSIDELPQLLNVVMGHMSVVGPRPHAMAHDTQYNDVVRNYAFRHHMKPGITGLAQVNGYRGETAAINQMAKRIEFDLWYINNWSIWLDLRILARTCFTVAKGSAY